MSEPGNVPAVDDELAEGLPGAFAPGYDSRRGTNGGRPRKLVEIERMLDAEHRNADNLRPVFAELRSLAMGWEEPVFYKGMQVATIRKHDPRYFELYFLRVLGPPKDLDAELLKEIEREMEGAPDSVLEWWRRARAA